MAKKTGGNDVLNTLLKATGFGLGVAVGAAGGWIAYSNLAIDHHAPLGKAILADTDTIPSEAAGALNCYVDRSAEDRPLFLIHSVNAAASSYEMAPIFNRYRNQRPVIALDLPGFGFSDRSDRLYSPRVYQEAILEAMAREVQGAADVVALSLGCEFAARAAAIEPERFRSLTMISPTGFSRPGATPSTRTNERRPEPRAYEALSFPLWGRPLFDLIASRPSIRYFLGLSFVGPVPEDMVDYDYATSHQPGAQYAPLAFIGGKLFTHGIFPAFYKRLDMPVLLVYDQDTFTSFETLPDAVAAHGNWSSARITPTRGLPQFEKMDDLAQALEAFWSGIDAGATTEG